MVLGACIAAAVGAVLAVPVVRLDSVYLALATLAFALMFQSIFVPLGWVSGGAVPLRVPRPVIGPFDLADDRYFLLFAMASAAVVAVVVIRIREGTTGRFLRALQSSDVAAASIGIGGSHARIVAFTVGAWIAGFGGGLTASFLGQANYESSFPYLIGLVWVALVVSSGSRSIQAAVLSGLFFMLFPALLTRLFTLPGNWVDSNPDSPQWLQSALGAIKPTWAQSVAFILFGIGAITYARHPEGSIEAQTAISVNAIVRRVEARRSRQGPGGGNGAAPTGGPSAPRVDAEAGTDGTGAGRKARTATGTAT
jgi:ABC-type branched-subunit amino acid transport system permease subunit